MFFNIFSSYIYVCLYYSLILRSYFDLLFLTHLATRHILQFTMFDSISLQPARNIMDIKKYFIVHHERKDIALIITKNQSMSFSSLIKLLSF